MFPCYLQYLSVLSSFQFVLLQTQNYSVLVCQLKPSFSYYLTYDVEILHCQHIGYIFASCQTGSRYFWSLAKVVSQNFCHSSFPPLKNNSGSSSGTPSSKANLFASTFASNSNLDDQDFQSPLYPTSTITISAIKFSTRKVRKVLLQLNTSKSSGPDGIPAIVLLSCAPELAPVLNKLFQLSYSLGIFHSSWKLAHIFPIPQKGDKSDPSNYRPIAITSLISKTMETIITRQLLAFLETNSLLSDH